MILYAITESYACYKGSDATFWGVYKTLQEAKDALFDIIKDRFDYIKDNIDEDDEDALEEEFEGWINKRYVKANDSVVKWEDYDDDAVTKFYIDETEIED